MTKDEDGSTVDSHFYSWFVFMHIELRFTPVQIKFEQI